MQKMHIAFSDKPVAYYSLDVIIPVGYRVKSPQGVEFRRWATRRLKDVLLLCIGGMALTQLTFAGMGYLGLSSNAVVLFVGLTVFFSLLNTPETLRPSLVSRLPPPAAKGSAMGIYSSAVSGCVRRWCGSRLVVSADWSYRCVHGDGRFVCGLGTSAAQVQAATAHDYPRTCAERR